MPIRLPLLLIPMAFTSTQPTSQPSPPAKPAQPAWPPFEAPPQEMKDLAWLAGSWSVTTTYIAPDGKAYPSKTEATIRPLHGGSFLQEEITIPSFKLAMTGIRSYDRFRKVYRIVWFDSIMSLADVYEGTLANSDLTVTNLKSGTCSIMPGGPETFLRITQRHGASRDEFSLIWEASTDKGATWKKTAVYDYTRKP